MICRVFAVRRFGSYDPVSKMILLNTYNVVRVEPCQYIDVCAPSSDYKNPHQHGQLMATVEEFLPLYEEPNKIVKSEKKEIATALCYRGTEALAGFCRFSKSSDSKVDFADIGVGFERRFFACLTNLPTTSERSYSLESIREAMRFAQQAIGGGEPILPEVILIVFPTLALMLFMVAVCPLFVIYFFKEKRSVETSAMTVVDECDVDAMVGTDDRIDFRSAVVADVSFHFYGFILMSHI